MALYGAAKAPAVQDPNGNTVVELGGTLTGSVTGDMADVSDIDVGLSTSDTYSDAAVNTAVNDAVNAAVAEINLQFKELQTKFNALIVHMNDGRS